MDLVARLHQRSSHRLVLIESLVLPLALSLSLLGSATARAQVEAEPDCWVTQTGSTIEVPALPQGFFGSNGGSPSDPFGPAVVTVIGLPLSGAELANCSCTGDPPLVLQWQNRHGTPVSPSSKHKVRQVLVPADLSNTDTCVVRLTTATFPGGTGVADTVDIQLEELSLVSTNPITVTYGAQPFRLFDVHVTEEGASPTGSLSLTPSMLSPPIGTMFLDGLPVAYQLRFEEVGGGAVFTMTGLSITFQGTTGTFAPNLGKNIPTVSEWGMLLLSIIAVGLGTLFVQRMPRRRIALASGETRSDPAPLLSAGLFAKVLVATLVMVAALLGIAQAQSGALAGRDVLGALVSAVAAAWVVHLWLHHGSGK